MKQLLYFKEEPTKGKTKRFNVYEEPTKGKTKRFNVYSAHSDDFLGTIHFRSGWRCYVMSYVEGIDMSLSCNKELNNFMKELEKERKVNQKQGGENGKRNKK